MSSGNYSDEQRDRRQSRGRDDNLQPDSPAARRTLWGSWVVSDLSNHSTRRLDIGVIGAGLMGREHVARLLANPRCRVAAVVDPAAKAAEWAALHRIMHYFDVEKMLSAQRFDGAIVATPNDMHVPTAISLLEAGVPVLVEKPVAESVAAGTTLIRKAQETGVPALIGHHRRHSPAIQAARECIAHGTLGRIVAINLLAVCCCPIRPWLRLVGNKPAGRIPYTRTTQPRIASSSQERAAH